MHYLKEVSHQLRDVEFSGKSLYYFVMLFFLVTPDYVAALEGFISYAITVGRMVVCGLILIGWLRRGRFSPMTILVILLYGIILLSTAINGTDMGEAIRQAVVNIAVVMLVDSEADHIENLWKACADYLGIMIVINFVTIVLYPDGFFNAYEMYKGYMLERQASWFFATKNGIGKYLVIYLYFKADSDYRIFGTLQTSFYVMAMVCVASVVLVWSATSMTACVLIILMMVALPTARKYQLRTFSSYFALGLIILMFIFCVLLQNVGFFSRFIVDVLQKDLTFDGRTEIWNQVMELIGKKPLTGYGYLNSLQGRMLLGNSHRSDAHNYLLTMGLYGGIPAMSVILIVLLTAVHAISKRQYTWEGLTATAFLLSFLLVLIFESTTMKMYWMVFAYAYYLGTDIVPEEAPLPPEPGPKYKTIRS